MKKYTTPELNITSFSVEDVITVDTSSIFTPGGDEASKVDQVKTVSYATVFGLNN